MYKVNINNVIFVVISIKDDIFIVFLIIFDKKNLDYHSE